MRPSRILASLAMLVAFGAPGYAQDGCARLSWGNCDPWVEDQQYTGPGTYKLVLSVYGVTVPNIGTDTQIRISAYTPLPDCWRFDDAGCQTGSRLGLNNEAVDEACPAMRGDNAHTTTSYTLNASGDGVLRLGTTYDSFTPSVATRYTVWQVLFDQAHSNPGPTPPDLSTCGGAERCVSFFIEFMSVRLSTGQTISLPACDTDVSVAAAAWNGCCGPECVPALPTTWGRVKATYR